MTVHTRNRRPVKQARQVSGLRLSSVIPTKPKVAVTANFIRHSSDIDEALRVVSVNVALHFQITIIEAETILATND